MIWLRFLGRCPRLSWVCPFGTKNCSAPPRLPESVAAVGIEPALGALQSSPDFRLWMLDPTFPKGRVCKLPLTALSRSIVLAVTDFEASACSEQPANSHHPGYKGEQHEPHATESPDKGDP